MTREGGVIGFVGKGKGQLRDPGILTDILTWNGEVHFMTMVKSLRWLQTTKCWMEASFNIASGEFHRRIYAKA